jgi:hypothetical protein
MRTTILGIGLTLFTAASLPAQSPVAWPSSYASVWQVEIGEGYSSGALVVARRSGDSFRLERKYDLTASETWARPVVTGGDLIVRDAMSLNRLTGK